MTIRSIFAALPILVTGTIASAQSVEFLSYGAGYTNLSVDGEDLSVLSLGGSVDYTNNGFVFNGNLNYVDLDGELDLTFIGARAGYFATPDLALYAGIDYFDADGFDAEAFNLGAEYKFGAATVGLNFTEFNFSGSELITTLYGSYQTTEALELGLSITDDGFDTSVLLAADYDLGETELFAFYETIDGFDVLAVSGNYDFGNKFRAGGSYVNFDSDVSLLAVSGGYEVSDSLWVDLSVGQADAGGSENLDVFGLTLSYETGRETLLIDRAETVQTRALGALGNLFAF